MPFYEYRQLTAKEREEIVRLRRDRGYPLHAPPHPFRHAGAYLITAVNYEHARVMDSALRRTDFELRLLNALKEIQADVNAWVVLANHYHALVGIDLLDSVSAAIQQLHGKTSREWNLEDKLTSKRHVWYRFTDRMIRDERQYYVALNYIHMNPVKHGYVNDPYRWDWSSVHRYVEEYGRAWLRETWQKNPPGEFGKGWDDA